MPTIRTKSPVITAKYQLTKACSKKKKVNAPQFFKEGFLVARTRKRTQNGIHSNERIWRWLIWWTRKKRKPQKTPAHVPARIQPVHSRTSRNPPTAEPKYERRIRKL